MACMEHFDTFFALKFAYLVFSATEQFSINLQAKDITIQEAINGDKLLTAHLKSLKMKKSLNVSMTKFATIAET